MIQKEIIEFVSSKTGIKNKGLIEKDIILHRLLLELTNACEFADNYVFKGGTCLTKCHFGYYRFSEDLDFTCIDQKKFEGKSEMQIRRIISAELNSLGKIIKTICDNIGLDFKNDKKDSNYFKYGGGNKFITMKLWYESEESKSKDFIKVEINFVDKILYPIKRYNAENLIGIKDKPQMAFLLSENSEWLIKIPSIQSYDIREILTEKVRAILTRKGVKGRDFLDVFVISKNSRLEPRDFKKEIIQKTKLMIDKYRKYANNIKNKNFQFLDKFVLGEEEKLLITKISEGLSEFLKDFKEFLEELLKELNSVQK